MAVTNLQIARWFKGGMSPFKIAFLVNLRPDAPHRTCPEPDRCAPCLATVEGRLRRFMRRQDKRGTR